MGLTAELRGKKDAFASTVVMETRPEMDTKRERVNAAAAVLRDHLRAVNPDVLLIYGDDQQEQFHVDNFPALCIFTGPEFSGFKVNPKRTPVAGGARHAA